MSADIWVATWAGMVAAAGAVGWHWQSIVGRRARAQALETAVAERTKQLQQEVARTAKLATVGQLVAGVGHEINNPLAYVLTNLDLLAEHCDEQTDPDLRASVNDARDGVERIRQIVRDLQVFSRADTSNEQSIDLHVVLERCARMASTQIRSASRLTMDLRRVPTIWASETRLGQVFLNLLVNAAQAIGEGNRGGNEITVASYTDAKGRAVVQIRDTGPGIPPDVLAHVFEPFFTTKAPGVGTGLGLSICRSIVEALRGELTVESTVGKGTTFTVVLPQPQLRRERKISAPLTPSMFRKRILVVDDEPLICRAVEKCLAAEHDVEVETSSRHALALIRAGQRYDVIFCDLMMPEIGGLDVYEAIRTTAPELLSKVVFMTGGVLNERTRGFLVGIANTLLEKPLDAKVLRRTVAEAPL